MEFNELEDLYNYLEDNAIDHKLHTISNLFQKIRDLKKEEGKNKEVEISQWEIDCFSFSTREGILKPMYVVTDDKGELLEYPSVSRSNLKNGFDFIKERLTKAKNPILVSRYAHILWESPNKHEKYAKVAVDSYLKMVEEYEKKDKAAPEEHHGLDVLNSIEQASFLAMRINYRIENIQTEICRLIKEFNYQSSSAFVMRTKLIRQMLANGAKFKPQCFKGIPEICRDLGEKLFKNGSFHRAISFFKIAQKVDNKLGLKTEEWNRKIAESYEGLIDQRDEGDLAVASFCQDAIGYYRKVKDSKKIKELEKKYKTFLGKQQFSKFGGKIEIAETLKACKDFAKTICEEDPEKIFSMLINNKNLLPKHADMEKSYNESCKDTIVMKTFPKTIQDRNGYPAEHFSNEEELKNFGILQQYHFHVQYNKQFLIDEIFFEAIKTKKLTVIKVLEFLEKKSWYGKNIKKTIPGNKTIEYNWLNLLAPGLNDYFIKMEIHFSYPEYYPDFILAMDSLSLKIEGLVRDICTFSGITTFYQIKDRQGRNIVREKDINRLLREEPIKELFDEDDLLFFRFVLVEKAGLNLRHKIAHCLIEYPEYSVFNIHLLLLVLFRLGKYDFVKSNTSIEEKVDDKN